MSNEWLGCGAIREDVSSHDKGSTSCLRALGQRAVLPSAITGVLGGLSQLMHPQGLAYPKCLVNAGYVYFQAQLMHPSHYPSIPSLGAVSDQQFQEFGSNTGWRLGERMKKGTQTTPGSSLCPLPCHHSFKPLPLTCLHGL